MPTGSYSLRAAHHVGVHNGYPLGIEREGNVGNAARYTTAIDNASAGLTRSFCSAYFIPCTSDPRQERIPYPKFMVSARRMW